jgi:methionine-rich copper-binding protein CopC
MNKNNRIKIVAPYAFFMICIASFTSCKEEFDHTIDAGNPIVVSYNPVSKVDGIAVGSNLVITFDEQIKKGIGSIHIVGKTSTQNIDIASDAVTIGDDKRVLIINPNDFVADENYAVTIDGGLVTDLLGNKFIGLPDGFSWTFKTVGKSGLALTSMAPVPASTAASVIRFGLTFASEVKKGSGNFTVYQKTGDIKVAEVSVASATVSVVGKQVTINMGTPLNFSTDYYILADAGTVVDADGKAFEGFEEKTSWSFKTTSGSGNSLAVYLPMDYDLSDASGNKLDAILGDKATTQFSFITDPERGRVASFPAGSYAVLPKHNLLRPSATQNFSYSMWFKVPAIGSDPALFSNSDWDSGGNPGFVFCLDGALTYTAGGVGSSGNGWRIKVADESRNRKDWKAGAASPQTPALADNKWHMVTVVTNRTTQLMHVYIDAVEYNQVASAQGSSINTLVGALWDKTNDHPFTIWEDGTGAYNAGSDTRKEINGFVDDLRIYNKALSADEIKGIYLTD